MFWIGAGILTTRRALLELAAPIAVDVEHPSSSVVQRLDRSQRLALAVALLPLTTVTLRVGRRPIALGPSAAGVARNHARSWLPEKSAA